MQNDEELKLLLRCAMKRFPRAYAILAMVYQKSDKRVEQVEAAKLFDYAAKKENRDAFKQELYQYNAASIRYELGISTTPPVPMSENLKNVLVCRK